MKFQILELRSRSNHFHCKISQIFNHAPNLKTIGIANDLGEETISIILQTMIENGYHKNIQNVEFEHPEEILWVLSSTHRWRPVEILDTVDAALAQCIQVHFIGFESKYDEMIPMSEWRKRALSLLNEIRFFK